MLARTCDANGKVPQGIASSLLHIVVARVTTHGSNNTLDAASRHDGLGIARIPCFAASITSQARLSAQLVPPSPVDIRALQSLDELWIPRSPSFVMF